MLVHVLLMLSSLISFVVCEHIHVFILFSTLEACELKGIFSNFVYAVL